MNDSKDEKPDCCKKDGKKESRGFLSGLVYGLIPHIGCIAFIIFTVLGVTTATAFFKPLLTNFYILIGLSFVFATISATIYLKKNEILSILGIKRKWKYLSALYGTIVLINLFLFMIFFPYTTNLISNPAMTGALTELQDISTITLQVAIPCPGHASVITAELNKITGITNVEFKFPNLFKVKYDTTKISKEQVISLEIFNTYKAIILEENFFNK